MVVESFRPGVVKRLGVGYDAVRAVNPRIVYCSTSGYGQQGPAAGWAGHDLNYLAIGGFLAASQLKALSASTSHPGSPISQWPMPGSTSAVARVP